MGSDRARNTYDEAKQYRRVVPQQGRVILEADLNESSAILTEDARHEMLDVIGPAGVPSDPLTDVDGTGYAISALVAKTHEFSIGPGVIYVGGWRVIQPDPELRYSNQPDWLDGPIPMPAPAPASPGFELALLRLREQEVSAVEDPTLREVALGGPDTAQRVRLIRRVERYPVTKPECNMFGDVIAAWTKLGLVFDPTDMSLAPTARLAVGTEKLGPDPKPCDPAANDGYLGAENQMIRVQIASATEFLWGYDDASALYRVELDPDDSSNQTLKFHQTPVDAFHQPHQDQYVEVLRAAAGLGDDAYAAATTGLVTTLKSAYQPDVAKVVLKVPLTSAYTDPKQTPALFLRVWQNRATFTAGTPQPLVDQTGNHTGLQVTLTSGPFIAGNFWFFAVRPTMPAALFPARYATPQLPEGPREWVCPLAVIDWTQKPAPTVADCRPTFDNLVTLTSEVDTLTELERNTGCCTVTVSPEDITEKQTLQTIVDQYKAPLKIGSRVTICLRPGVYKLAEPLRLGEAHSGLAIEGCHGGAVIEAAQGREGKFLDGLFVLVHADEVTLRGLRFHLPQVPFAKSGGLVAALPFSRIGSAAIARFSFPSGVAVDSAGDVYVADTGNQAIRKVSAGGVVTTLAGAAGTSGSADGTGAAARLFSPSGITVDGAGNVYVADTDNHTIRKVSAGGVVTTLAGAAGIAGSADGTGAAARFSVPSGVAVDSAGNVYVADTGNHTIRKVTATGAVATLAGAAGMLGSADGPGAAARFNAPRGVAVDSAGNVHVADIGNHTIRKVTAAGAVTTSAGAAGIPGKTDGTGAAARFNVPRGVAVDRAGNLYVADTDNHTIRKVTAAGVVTTLAGAAGVMGSADGTGAAARFNSPFGVAVDSARNVYVADTGNRTIRKVTAAGAVTTLAGAAAMEGNVAGSGATELERLSSSIAIRPVHAAELTVEDCLFRYSLAEGQHVFGVGIFAGSECWGLRIVNNKFVMDEDYLRHADDLTRMLYGYLLAPTVTVTLSPPPPPPPPPPGVRAAQLSDEVTGGTVVWALLNEAEIHGNLFSGMIASALILADCGTIRIEDNRVRESYGGFWITSFGSMAPHNPDNGLTHSANTAGAPDLETFQRDPLAFTSLILAAGYPAPPGLVPGDIQHVNINRKLGVDPHGTAKPPVPEPVEKPPVETKRPPAAKKQPATAKKQPPAAKQPDVEKLDPVKQPDASGEPDAAEAQPDAAGKFLSLENEELALAMRFAADTGGRVLNLRGEIADAIGVVFATAFVELTRQPLTMGVRIVDNDIDARIEGFVSGAALVVSDAGTDPRASVIVSANRIANASIALPTVLIIGHRRIAITGNLMENDTLDMTPDVQLRRLLAQLQALGRKVVTDTDLKRVIDIVFERWCLVAEPSSTSPNLADRAAFENPLPLLVAITGNVLEGLNDLPVRLGPALPPWDALNTLSLGGP